MTSRRSLQCLVALLVSASAPAAAQNPQPGQKPGDSAKAEAAPLRTMRASRLTGAISIDGKLDEPAWATAVPSSDFMQSYPKVGAKATDPTEVRVLYDDDALYVGVRMFDAHPDSIAAQLARRDASGIYSDWLHVMIDSYRDRRTSFRFSVNPRGVQKDVLEFDDRNGEDLNWDAVWEVATRVDSVGWTAEYRIPFSQLRFGGAQK
ncbi:MAG TPA: carbohydrate binding family 9 domain-containing protein, partial [Gemmatimonadaceae bacterium]|nr:carbohydrate binding family 9 domain-containing protein [Gemmatimonadaceae bacterium]